MANEKEYRDMLIALLIQAYPMLGNEPSSEAELQNLIFLKENINSVLEYHSRYYALSVDFWSYRNI